MLSLEKRLKLRDELSPEFSVIELQVPYAVSVKVHFMVPARILISGFGAENGYKDTIDLFD